MSPISNLGTAANFGNVAGAPLAFDPLPIPGHLLSPIPGGSIGDVIQHLPPMSGGNLGDVIQNLPPMSGGSLGDLLGGLLNGNGPVLHPSFPHGRQTVD